MEIPYIDEEDEIVVGELKTGYIMPTTAVERILKGEHNAQYAAQPTLLTCCDKHLKKKETGRKWFW